MLVKNMFIIGGGVMFFFQQGPDGKGGAEYSHDAGLPAAAAQRLLSGELLLRRTRETQLILRMRCDLNLVPGLKLLLSLIGKFFYETFETS